MKPVLSRSPLGISLLSVETDGAKRSEAGGGIRPHIRQTCRCDSSLVGRGKSHYAGGFDLIYHIFPSLSSLMLAQGERGEKWGNNGVYKAYFLASDEGSGGPRRSLHERRPCQNCWCFQREGKDRLVRHPPPVTAQFGKSLKKLPQRGEGEEI
ncbi:hypothetical protein, unlikely [Trypanosoma brucei gambiense DAL972]|uniref:Uncharacterized protein n=1 Tax=Trypanosoma brucei gambiense (strain MHOM/CI/86/DAL972) TaxID=679716 RepID=D0A9F0_TRYB9|nr:hypothetical protein, unlikely [Trypanosoma brucei gambiense DAL972]CBH18301.1 hypothetical protein, unlikely [Trypanosoma brucei gambiense DAL972]|eukprot:XP_011780565.1 hypothetical protein, unlikely [Trypanosoma brucei gambiense DAL972]